MNTYDSHWGEWRAMELDAAQREAELRDSGDPDRPNYAHTNAPENHIPRTPASPLAIWAAGTHVSVQANLDAPEVLTWNERLAHLRRTTPASYARAIRAIRAISKITNKEN